MFTPSKHSVSMSSMSPMEPASSQRISLSLSDLVSPGLREFDEETKTSVNSGNDATNYKRELKKLLTKSRGTAYEATLRRFVEAKYNEIKKDEAANRKSYGHPKGPGAMGTPSIASMSSSKYDPPNCSQLQANMLDLHNIYQGGRIVENNVNTSFSIQQSPFQSKSYARSSSEFGSVTGTSVKNSATKRPLYGHGNSMGYSILNEVSFNNGKSVSFEVTPHNKSRIEEMAKPMERNVYKGPPAPAPFSSTNHLGRQRPPPQPDAKSPERRPVSASPYSSPYRKRKAASITDRSGGGAAAGGSGSGTAGSFAPGGTNNGNNNGGGSGRGSSSGSVAPGEDLASVTSFPEQFRFLGELDRQSNSKSYQEFKQWLATNRDWMRKCERKIQSKGDEVIRDKTNDFKPKILAKSVRLAEIANKRDFQRIASMSAPYPEASAEAEHCEQQEEFHSLGLGFNLGHTTPDSRSRSRSPTRSPSPNMRMVYNMAAAVNANINGTDSQNQHKHAQPTSTSAVLHSSSSQQQPQPQQLHQHHQQRPSSALRSFSKDSHDDFSVHSAPAHQQQALMHQKRASSAPRHHSAVPPAAASSSSLSAAPSLPDNVFERLAMRGRMKAQQTFHYDLPPTQETFAPRISEHSVRLAERKHQRDANIRSRSASREPSGHRDSTTTNATAPADEQQPTYLPRNYDYYELYTMPARYMHRIENPERYKSSGTVPRNNIRDDQDRIILAESGLSKVTRMRQERSGRSPSPAAIITRAASSDASASVSISQHQKQHHQQKMTQQVVDKSESASTSGNGQASADRAMRMSELSATGTASVTSAPTSRAPSTVPFSVPPSSSSAPPALLQSNLSIKVDDGGKYYTHPAEGRPMRVPSPMHDRSQRAASPGNYGAHGPSREDVGSQANVSVRIIAKEGIEQKKHLSRKMREQQLAEFNRRHFLSKESKEAKPFQPLLLATETHRIMSRSNSTFEERTNKSVENLYVRREVARRFPSPGPGRYTGGIGIEKLVQTLSVGSPRKVERSRSCSPVPGHRGFSFGKEALGRIEVVSPNGATSSSGAATAAAIGGAGAGVGSPNATMNSASR